MPFITAAEQNVIKNLLRQEYRRLENPVNFSFISFLYINYQLFIYQYIIVDFTKGPQKNMQITSKDFEVTRIHQRTQKNMNSVVELQIEKKGSVLKGP